MRLLKLTLIALSFFMILLVLQDEEISGLSRYQPKLQRASKEEKDYETTYIPFYKSKGIEQDVNSLQCPVPIENRVKNYTGIQCVYSSLEMLGRWAEEPKLINPPLTSRPDCQGYSSPKRAAKILNSLGIKFEQTYGDEEKGIKLIKKAMLEGRACLIDVPGHAMVLVHYDEKQNKVCWVDNSDYSLKVQKDTIQKFQERWGSWVCIIYADNDLFPYKVYKNLTLKIIDHEKLFNYPFNYIPIPMTKL